MKSLLNCFHYMAWHDPNRDREVFKRFQPDWVKLVRFEADKMPYVDVAMEHANKVLIRSHPISENWGNRGVIDTPEKAIQVGDNIANAYKNILQWIKTEYGFSDAQMEKIVVEGALNEPMVWTNGERSEMVAICTKQFTDNMTASGIQVAAGGWGVGWEGNHDTAATPHKGAIPDWSAYSELFKSVAKNGGWLHLHEYCDYLETDSSTYGYKRNWGWWGGHLYSLLPYFNAAGVKLPILVTEAGIDNYVNPSIASSIPRGWHSLINSGNRLPEAAARYVDILGWYDQQLIQFPDGLVEGIFPYTYDFQDKQWESFNVAYTEFLDRLKGHIDWVENGNQLEAPIVPAYDTDVPWYPAEIKPPIEPPIEPPIVPPIEPPVVPPADIDIDTIRWNAEEAVRGLERAMSEIGKSRRRLMDNVIAPLSSQSGNAEVAPNKSVFSDDCRFLILHFLEAKSLNASLMVLVALTVAMFPKPALSSVASTISRMKFIASVAECPSYPFFPAYSTIASLIISDFVYFG